MNGQTMREQLEGAWEPEDDAEESLEAEVEETQEESTLSGEEAKATETEEASSDVEGGDEDALREGLQEEESGTSEEAVEEEVEQPESEYKAPASWTPKAREFWEALPSDVQAEVDRREREISRGLQEASGHRKVAEEYQNIVKPYEALIASQNSTPSQSISNLMNTAARLLMGTPAQKAQVVAEIVNNYGVDVYQLDTVLSGQELPNSQSLEVANLLDQRLQPINQFMQEIQGQRQQTVQEQTTQAQQAVEQFADKAEFYEDVREDMADMMDLAARRDQQLSLEDAYDRACRMHPQISEILTKREAAKRNTVDKETLAKKKAAASSVSGRQSAEPVRNADGSLMGTIRDIWDDLEEGA